MPGPVRGREGARRGARSDILVERRAGEGGQALSGSERARPSSAACAHAKRAVWAVAAQGGRRRRNGAVAPARRAHARSYERGSARACVRPPQVLSLTTTARLRLNARAAACQSVFGAAGFRPPTARLRLRRPSEARSAERGADASPVARAPQAFERTSATSCQAPLGAIGFRLLTTRLRFRATRGARSEEDIDICARHRRHATVSSASFAFPEGGTPSGASACRVRTALRMNPVAHVL